jgi:hypothetical protein
MSSPDTAPGPEDDAERARAALLRYAEPLLREVAQRLLRPRNQWPAEELAERTVAALTNAAVIDRRLKDLPASARKLLAAVGLSRRPVWRVGHLLALLATLGHAEGLTPVLELLGNAFAFPEFPEGLGALKQFEDWLGPSGISAAKLFVPPTVSARALNEDLGFPELPAQKLDPRPVRQGDGLEWLLRTAAAWQRVSEGPVRLTQQQTLFKRDLQRFQADALLASPFAEHLTDLSDAGLLALELAIAAGLIEANPYELVRRPAPALWDLRLAEALAALWTSLFTLENWHPVAGYQVAEDGGNFPSVALAAFLALRSPRPGEWVRAESVAVYLFEKHPSWAATLGKKRESADRWVEALYLGLGVPLRVVEAAQEAGGWWFRLGDVGRHLLRGGPVSNLDHDFRQTLVVQPNGEVVVFRQGLTPALVGRLTRFSDWKTFGAACTMELTAESVYRGLETGLTLPEMLRLLEQHGTRAIPATVLDSLRRWSDKRERITVYTSATLLEFVTPADLEAAAARGLVLVRLTDRIGIAASGGEIDYKHFRLVGNRDYEARPQKCVTFEPDGATFAVDVAQSDLILEAELGRLAEPLPASSTGPRRFALTPASLKRAQAQGFTLADMEQWALDRTGESLSAAARLLYAGSGGVAGSYGRRLVVVLPTEAVADGVVQWPATGRLVADRLGPRAVAVAEPDLASLLDLLRGLGIDIKPEGA